MREQKGPGSVAVMRAVGAYLEKAREAARGEGPSILDYTHIMELVSGLDGDETRALLWMVVPRFMQCAVDLEQVGQRATRAASFARGGYPPIGVPPCEPVEPTETLRKAATPPRRDRLEGSSPSEHGAAVRKGKGGELLLMLEFYPEDLGDWFGDWLDLEHQFAKGISLGVEHFDLDTPMLGKLKSHGWRDRSMELQIRWDDGFILFRRVVPVQVSQAAPGASVVVAFILDGDWTIHETHHDDDEGLEEDYSIDHETGQVMKPVEVDDDDEPESGEGFPDAELQAKFRMTIEEGGDDDDSTE